jgi:NADP-dependent 3-hydroxy acid dehydrogenase YdfG
MKIELKPFREQVIVITEATASIGWATARLAARLGARVVVAGRDENLLQRLTEETHRDGGEIMSVHADISKEEDVRRIVSAAVRTFGSFDSWINTAAGSVSGKCSDASASHIREVFETNFWGLVYGSRAAVTHYKKHQISGTIINVASREGQNTSQDMICTASRFAVQGWTNALRAELEKEKAPVSISTVFTARVNPVHLPAAGMDPGCVAETELTQTPEVVADAILHCAQHPKRNIYIANRPGLFDRIGNAPPGFLYRMRHAVSDVVEHMGSPPRSPDQSEAERPRRPSESAREPAGAPAQRKVNGFSVLSTLVLAGLSAGVYFMTRSSGKQEQRSKTEDKK